MTVYNCLPILCTVFYHYKIKPLKTWKSYTYLLLLVFLFSFIKVTAFSQTTGRVVINEYMPWTSNGCGATAEFIELMNFGPGPMNIGCYILTDGDYSITIPPNTILKPGEFYVISGQDIIPAPCANIDSTIHANLNWNTCGCTSAPIPTTGDGFLTDGGGASEQLVLLDPNLNVVDAVIRNYPLEPSSVITTSGVGGCGSKTFDLNTMAINYEVLGMSAGRGNSFARKLDGDCEWVKDPQQSAHATNNRTGGSSGIAYDFTIVNAMDCNGTHGSIDIYVKFGDYSTIFPMTYTIVKDANNDGIFDLTDTYTYGVDSTPPSIYIDGFEVGRYRITVASVKGCYLQTFDFTILPCRAVLPVQLQSFKLVPTIKDAYQFRFVFSDVENLKELVLEKSIDGNQFISDRFLPVHSTGIKEFFMAANKTGQYQFYRLKFISKNGAIGYSSTINTSVNVVFASEHLWPSPATSSVHLLLSSTTDQGATYTINGVGGMVKMGNLKLNMGHNALSIPISSLSPGIYQIVILKQKDKDKPISLRFVKQ